MVLECLALHFTSNQRIRVSRAAELNRARPQVLRPLLDASHSSVSLQQPDTLTSTGTGMSSVPIGEYSRAAGRLSCFTRSLL